MLFQFNKHSSILLIFFIQGLVYCFLFLKKGIKKESKPDLWLAFFLALSVLYISPWMLGFAGWYDAQPYRDILFYIPFLQLFFIGPSMYFYVQSILNRSFTFKKNNYWHFLPGTLYLLYSLIIFSTDKVILHKYYFLANGADPDFDTWYQISGFVSMIAYLFASLRYYNFYKKITFDEVSFADSLLFKWIRNFLIAFSAILIIRFGFFVFSLFMQMEYSNAWWYYIAFSVAIYYISISGYSNSLKSLVTIKVNEDEIINQPLKKDKEVIPQAPLQTLETIEPNSVNDDLAFIEKWKKTIESKLIDDKLYENPELLLSDLSKAVNLNQAILSRVINKGIKMNFNDFINFHRIQAVKQKIKLGEHQSKTLLGIAYECGFNSKATFNRAFKKVSNYNPREWMAKENL